MKQFGSFLAVAEHLMLRAPMIAVELHHSLEAVARRIETTAKGEFGHYQPAHGPFPEWPELADSTKDERVKAGFSENEPLLRTGELQDSISHEVQGLEAAIGSTDERMPYHEFGTSRIPARPVLGPAAFLNKDAIRKLVGAAAMAGLIGGDQVHAALGYDFKTED